MERTRHSNLTPEPTYAACGGHLDYGSAVDRRGCGSSLIGVASKLGRVGCRSPPEDAMTTVVPKPIVTRPWPVRHQVRGSALARMLRTTDAKQIGIMYMITSFVFFMLGGLMALLMRAELARPGHAVPVAGAVQPAVHHARHDHAAVLRDADRVRLRELRGADPDRRAGRGVPAAELRSPTGSICSVASSRVGRVPHPGRRGRLRLDRVHPAQRRPALARRRRQHVGGRPGALRVWAPSSAAST